jgi:hypothetical protein
LVLSGVWFEGIDRCSDWRECVPGRKEEVYIGESARVTADIDAANERVIEQHDEPW